MDDSVEAVDGDIVLKIKKFLVDYEENEICVSCPQNFIYAFSDTVGEGKVPNRGKSVIDLSAGEVPVPTATGDVILLDSDGKIRMQYVVSDHDPDVEDGTRGTMDVTLTISKTAGFFALGFPD